MKAQTDDAYHAARRTIDNLCAAGHVALLAGGCVRDMLLSHVPMDYDVATDATPKQVQKLFPRSRKVGAKFGVVLVRKFGYDIEVATFRKDGPYSDGRHPDEVVFGTETEDAKRRDFTINGLFYDPARDHVIDHVGGRADLKRGIIRTIGDPERRFSEDHLRMLRAVRFAARLSFPIEPDTLGMIKRLAPRLRVISPERIWMEIEQILGAATRAVGWALLCETELCNHLVDGWEPGTSDVGITRCRLQALPPRPVDATVALAAILVPQSAEKTAGICRALRLANRQINGVAWLLATLPKAHGEANMELADLKQSMANDNWPGLLDLLRADLVATQRDPGLYDRLKARAAQIPPCAVTPPPLLDGDQLTAMGVAPGPRLGEILQTVYRAQLNEDITDHDEAVELARELTMP